MLTKTPGWIRLLYPGLEWKRSAGGQPTIYMTFDDGPIPELTPWVLDCLKAHSAHATFFCVGENAERYPEILERIRDEGHAIGNHTFNHLNGWRTPTSRYLSNVARSHVVAADKLFRPPYGRMRRRQIRHIKKQGYRVVMWDILPQDYRANISPQQCLKNSLKCRDGSVVVFHDNLKAIRNLKYVLPRFLAHYAGMGYRFSSLR